jgi:hypothetical protein
VLACKRIVAFERFRSMLIVSEARVHSQGSSYRICVEQSCTGAGVFSEHYSFPSLLSCTIRGWWQGRLAQTAVLLYVVGK